MILDTIENSNKYLKLNSRFEKAFKFLKETNLNELETGKHEIDGDEIFALVMKYTTEPFELKKWEAHKKYIDIQYVFNGSEIISCTPVKLLTVVNEYSSEKDVAFFEETSMWTDAKMKDGYFAIFYPEDAHKPACQNGTISEVIKIVVKVKV